MYLEKSFFYFPVVCIILTWVYLYFFERGLNEKIDRCEEGFLKELRKASFELSERNRAKDRELKEVFAEIDRELNELMKAKETLLKEVSDLKRPSNAVKEDILQNFV